MKLTFALALLAGLATQARADDTWIDVAHSNTSTGDMTWSLKKGSVVARTNRGGLQVMYGEMRVTDNRARSVTLQENYVLINDCKRGQGKLKTLDMDGNWMYDNDWSSGAGSIATTIAEFLCAVYKRNDDNGI